MTGIREVTNLGIEGIERDGRKKQSGVRENPGGFEYKARNTKILAIKRTKRLKSSPTTAVIILSVRVFVLVIENVWVGVFCAYFNEM